VRAWELLTEGDMASVWAEEGALFQIPSSSHFLVHVKVVNESSGPIGLDIGDYWSLIGPFYYAESDQPEMALFDYMSRIPPEMTDSISSELVQRFGAGGLMAIPEGGELSYYMDFNGMDREKLDSVYSPWIVVGMGGWIMVADSSNAEIIVEEPGMMSLAYPVPITWDIVPAGSVLAVDGDEGPSVGLCSPFGVFPLSRSTSPRCD